MDVQKEILDVLKQNNALLIKNNEALEQRVKELEELAEHQQDKMRRMREALKKDRAAEDAPAPPAKRQAAAKIPKSGAVDTEKKPRKSPTCKHCGQQYTTFKCPKADCQNKAHQARLRAQAAWEACQDK